MMEWLPGKAEVDSTGITRVESPEITLLERSPSDASRDELPEVSRMEFLTTRQKPQDNWEEAPPQVKRNTELFSQIKRNPNSLPWLKWNRESCAATQEKH